MNRLRAKICLPASRNQSLQNAKSASWSPMGPTAMHTETTLNTCWKRFCHVIFPAQPTFSQSFAPWHRMKKHAFWLFLSPGQIIIAAGICKSPRPPLSESPAKSKVRFSWLPQQLAWFSGWWDGSGSYPKNHEARTEHWKEVHLLGSRKSPDTDLWICGWESAKHNYESLSQSAAQQGIHHQQHHEVCRHPPLDILILLFPTICKALYNNCCVFANVCKLQ